MPGGLLKLLRLPRGILSQSRSALFECTSSEEDEAVPDHLVVQTRAILWGDTLDIATWAVITVSARFPELEIYSHLVRQRRN